MSTAQDEYKKFKDFADQQQEQMFQLVSVGNDYDPLIRNTAVYLFGKRVCTVETHTLPHLVLAVERYIAQLIMKPEEMYGYTNPEDIADRAKAVRKENVY